MVQALKHYPIPVLKSALCQRVPFAESAAQGLTVYELDPEMLASQEMNQFTEEVLGLLPRSGSTSQAGAQPQVSTPISGCRAKTNIETRAKDQALNLRYLGQPTQANQKPLRAARTVDGGCAEGAFGAGVSAQSERGGVLSQLGHALRSAAARNVRFGEQKTHDPEPRVG